VTTLVRRPSRVPALQKTSGFTLLHRVVQVVIAIRRDLVDTSDGAGIPIRFHRLATPAIPSTTGGRRRRGKSPRRTASIMPILRPSCAGSPAGLVGHLPIQIQTPRCDPGSAKRAECGTPTSPSLSRPSIRLPSISTGTGGSRLPFASYRSTRKLDCDRTVAIIVVPNAHHRCAVPSAASSAIETWWTIVE
jgi:hypothetical protein